MNNLKSRLMTEERRVRLNSMAVLLNRYNFPINEQAVADNAETDKELYEIHN